MAEVVESVKTDAPCAKNAIAIANPVDIRISELSLSAYSGRPDELPPRVSCQVLPRFQDQLRLQQALNASMSAPRRPQIYCLASPRNVQRRERRSAGSSTPGLPQQLCL